MSGAHLLKVLGSRSGDSAVCSVFVPAVCLSSCVLRDVSGLKNLLRLRNELSDSLLLFWWCLRAVGPSAHHSFIVTSGGAGADLSLSLSCWFWPCLLF